LQFLPGAPAVQAPPALRVSSNGSYVTSNG
jgi:hypothetical protein